MGQFHLLNMCEDGHQLALGGGGIEVLDLPACTPRFTLTLDLGAHQLHFQPEGLGMVDAAPDVQEEHVHLVSPLDGSTLYTFSHERDCFSDTRPRAFAGRDLLITCGATGELLLHHPHLEATETWETGSPEITLLKFQQGLLLVGDVTGQVQLYNVHEKKQVQSFQAFDSCIHRVDFATSGSHFLTLGNNNQVQVWDAHTCEVRFQHTFGHPTHLARLGPDGSLLAALWVKEDEQCLEVLSTTTGAGVYDTEERSTTLSFSASPPALWGFGERIPHWSLPDFEGTEVLEPARIRKGQVIHGKNTFHVEGDWGSSAGDVSPDGRFLVMARSTRTGGVVLLWDLHHHRETHRIHFEDTVKQLQWNASTGQVVVHLHNGAACLWKPESHEQRPLPGAVQAITLDPGGQLLAVSTWDCEVHLLDAATFKVLQTLKGFSSPVDSLAFGPLGKHLVTASGTVDPQSTFNVYRQGP